MYKVVNHPLETTMYQLKAGHWVEVAHNDGIAPEMSFGPDIAEAASNMLAVSTKELKGDYSETIYVEAPTQGNN